MWKRLDLTAESPRAGHTATLAEPSEWWRSAVIYQIYPRSFADSNGDGIGDLRGIRDRLPALVELGVDAVWLSPFYTSPQRDAGYDVADYCDVDPIFGSLVDFDAMIGRAHELGIRVIVDIVPNHSSDEHPWFVEALSARPGGPERERYIFRDGQGAGGELPPNNWDSVFGGPAWTRTADAEGSPGQWFLHLFDTTQPDLNWRNPWVHEQFEAVLRFWLDRGVDGFRVDVAHGMIKAEGLPDWTPPQLGGSMGGVTSDAPDADQATTTSPFWGQDDVHDIHRSWRLIVDSYPGYRVLVAEAWIDPLTRMAEWVRPDEMHQAFNFQYLETPWVASRLRQVISASLSAFSEVGAPSTWVLSNHDVVRHATRLALTITNPQGHGIGARSSPLPDPQLALGRARAATALMLALPGSAYIYQGEELGLPEAVMLPDEARQDPTWFRSGGERYGRDGCRVPLPWEAESESFGFGSNPRPWLPQPPEWSVLARDVQRDQSDSTLAMYTHALALRRDLELGTGDVEWLESGVETVLALRNRDVLVYANTGPTPFTLPETAVVFSSGPLDGGLLAADMTVWLRAPGAVAR
jgi:alpha-glucosidase